MTAFNIVKFRVKPGHQEQFIAKHRGINPGLKASAAGHWLELVDARPLMIGILDGFREHLEDLGGGLGLTDPVSGEVVLKLSATKSTKKARGKKTTKRKKRR
jgi:hypothetical protein